jgi:hypothetical protein
MGFDEPQSFVTFTRDAREKIGRSGIAEFGGLVDGRASEFAEGGEGARESVDMIASSDGQGIWRQGGLLSGDLDRALRACEFNGQTPCLIPENTGDYLVRRLD